MSKLFEKIRLGLTTYIQARYAISRQFNADEIKRVQNRKLQRLMNYCFANIKYYKELFEQAGIRPGRIKTTADIVDIPVLTKDELRNRFWDFLPARLPTCRLSRTSGSTGVPLCILSDNNSRIFNSAAVIRYRKALNIPFFGRTVISPLKTENEPDKEPHWTFLQGIHKTYYVNPYTDITEYQSRILAGLKKPVIIGITPAVRALAYKIRDNILPILRPSAVLTTGEWLSPQVRELLESIFGIKVTDIYACNEAGDVAWQCHLANGYHINADNCIVEVLKDNKPAKQGEIGEVVITNLDRFSMPIIRYKNGDLARLTTEPCPCGCRLPMIAEIAGRAGDDIYLPNGKMIPWNQLKSLMNHPLVHQFQLVQNQDGNLTVKYSPQKGANTAHLEKLLLYRYSKLLNSTLAIKFECVERIVPDPSGKSKLVISYYKPVM